MLTPEQNQRLTQVGPGTPMGELMRRYWQPVAAEAELMNQPTKRVRILGEDLTLYKDGSGTYGLIGQRCPHRLVNMAAGIPEQHGLRCIYHGWLFDETGACLETPAEPPASAFKDKVRISAYPVEVMGGLVWGYLGPQPAPLLPRWDLFVWENVYRQIGQTVLPANWLQCQENSADSWHAHFTHGLYATYLLKLRQQRGEVIPEAEREAVKVFLNPDARHAYERYEYGMLKRRMRQGDSEQVHGWRVGHPMLFPNYVRIGKKGWFAFQMRVPMDDTHTWHLQYEVARPGEGITVPPQDVVPLFDVPLMEHPDYILGQDFVAWHEQGPITDRSQEMLGRSDEGVILLRRMLEEQMRVVEEGGDPINTFRDPASNQCIELPTEDYGGMETYRDGAFSYYDTGHYGMIGEIEGLFQQAKSAAKARNGG
ncbi:MAG: Rieske 2Fe-2S domain-containing protein [Chloroflexota bacterium]